MNIFIYIRYIIEAKMNQSFAYGDFALIKYKLNIMHHLLELIEINTINK